MLNLLLGNVICYKEMRRIMYVILACSLAVFAYGVVTDCGLLITGGAVLSSCMVGSLVGDSIRRKEPVSRGLLGGLIIFEVLSLVLMGLFMADYFLEYSLLPVSMPESVIGLFVYSSISVVLGLGLLWYYCRKGGKG